MLRPAAKRLPPDELRQIALAAALLPEKLAPHHQIAELARGVVRTTIEPPIDDDTDPDPGAEGDEGKVLQVPRRPSPAFAECRGVGVVLDDDWNVKLGFQEIAQRHPRPASQVPRGQDDPGLGIDQPGDGDPDASQVGPLLPAVGKQGIDGRDQPIDHRFWSDLGRRREYVLRQDGVGRELPRQQRGLRPADVDAQHDVASVRIGSVFANRCLPLPGSPTRRLLLGP